MDPTALDIETLTYTLLGEARGEGEIGMHMVANVIRNRAESGLYSDNPVDVVLEEAQFTTNDPDRGNQATTRAQVLPGSALYAQAENIVRTVIYGDNPGDPTGGSLFYHTTKVSPSWSKSVTTQYGTITAGNHVYYPRHPVPPKDIPNKSAAPSIIDITAGGKLPDGKAIKPTPFSKQRGGEIQGVVFHHTVGSTLKSALASAGKSGAQYYIDRDGQIYQYASDETRVAHMQFPGSQYRTDIDQPTAHLGNDNTLGVEIVAMDENDITPEQKEAAAALAYHLANKYAIPADMIVGHGQLQGTAPNGNRRLMEGAMPAEYARGYVAQGKTPPALANIEGAFGSFAEAANWRIQNAAIDYTNQSSAGMWRRFSNPPIAGITAPTIDQARELEAFGVPVQYAAFDQLVDSDPYGVMARGFGGPLGDQDAQVYRNILNRSFAETVRTPTIDEAISLEAYGSPVAYFDFEPVDLRDPIGLNDRGAGSLLAPNTRQDSAERRIYEARREQQYQVARDLAAQATRAEVQRNNDIAADIEAVGGVAIPVTEGELTAPAVTKAELFGPAFAPQRLGRPTAAPGAGLTREQQDAMREVPRQSRGLVWPPPSEIIVSTSRPETIDGRGRLMGSPNNNFDTPLSAAEESIFRVWKSARAAADTGEDYDYRGAYRAGVEPDANGHWPDTFKKPNHPTFSTDSQYAVFAPDLAGHWRGDVYMPPPRILQMSLEKGLTPKAVMDEISRQAAKKREIEEAAVTPERPDSVVSGRPLAEVVDEAPTVPRETPIPATPPEERIAAAQREVQANLARSGQMSATTRTGVLSDEAGPRPQPRAPMANAVIQQRTGMVSDEAPRPKAPAVVSPGRERTGMLSDEAPRPVAIPKTVVIPAAKPVPIARPGPIGPSYPTLPVQKTPMQQAAGVVADVVKRAGSVGTMLQTLGRSVTGEIDRVTTPPRIMSAPPGTAPLPKAKPATTTTPAKPAPAVPPSAKPGTGVAPKPLKQAIDIELVRPTKVSTATVKPVRTGMLSDEAPRPASKPAPAMKQLMSKPAASDKTASKNVRAAIVTPKHVTVAPSTVSPRTTVTRPAPKMARTINPRTGTIVATPASQGTVYGSRGYTPSSSGRNNDYFSYARDGSVPDINFGIDGDGRSGGGGSLV